MNSETPKEAQSETDGSYGIKSIGLALRLIETLATSETPRGVTELSKELGVNKWRVFRNLHTLREEGYVSQDEETDKFRLSMKLYLLATAVPGRVRFHEMLRREMELLEQKVGATVVVTTPVRDSVVVLETVVRQTPIRVSVERGARLALHASAHGKIALAFGPKRLFEGLPEKLHQLTEHTVCRIEDLRDEISKVREQGWALAAEESYPGLTALAVPFFSAGSVLEGSIGIFAPRQMIDSSSNGDQIQALLGSAQRISVALGGV